MKLCECGCGNPAPIAERTDSRAGAVKGEPRRFILGHRHRCPDPAFVVDKDTGCWVWQRHIRPDGYGEAARGRRSTRSRLAHRMLYERLRGPIPDGLQLDHLCRNRACVNPDHLEPVTNAENSRRGIRTKLTAADVRAIRSSTEPLRTLAERYGVSHNYVQGLRTTTRREWRDAA